MDDAQPDLYQQADPDPPPPEEPAPTQKAARGKPGPKPKSDDPRAAAKREVRARAAEEKRARNQDATKPAPQVSAEQATKSAAEQVVYTMSSLTEEQRKCREMTLGLLSHGWASLTAKFLGHALVMPAEADRAAFDELVKRRPDVGAAAQAWDGWVTAFDAVSVKRGWYREIPAEAMLLVSTLILGGTCAGVWFGNIQAAKAEARAERESQARTDNAAEAASAPMDWTPETADLGAA